MGGVPPYSYSWNTNPVQTTASATGLSAGNYIVTVIDKNGCLSGTQLVSVKSNGGTFPASQSFSPILCNGDQNGTATVVPLGGTLPYTYAWSTSPVQSTSFASNLSAGTYTCITTDGVGCTHASIVTIPSPAKLNISVTHVVNVPCKGGSNGSAGIAVAGGVGTINYVWNTSPAQTTAAINNLSAGNYSVTVKDSNNCTATQSITLTEGKPMVLTIGSTLASCGIKDGTATVTATVGTSPYTYLWLTNPVQSSATATGLSGGIYTIIVTDANGCTQQTTSTITGDSPPKADFFIPDTITLLNPKMHFINNSIGNYTISNWKFGDPLSTNDSSRLQHPTHEYTNTGKYCIRLIVVDKHGICKDTVIKCLTVVNPFTFYVPNAFTPNDNKMNEVFMGYGTSCKTFNMKIFDRWGNKVFETNNLSEGWNGKMNNTGQEVQEDEFVWKVHVTDIFGKEHDYIGHIAKIK
jgi:gliding motility-associated-like protein